MHAWATYVDLRLVDDLLLHLPMRSMPHDAEGAGAAEDELGVEHGACVYPRAVPASAIALSRRNLSRAGFLLSNPRKQEKPDVASASASPKSILCAVRWAHTRLAVRATSQTPS